MVVQGTQAIFLTQAIEPVSCSVRLSHLQCVASQVRNLPPLCPPSHALRSPLHVLQVLLRVSCSSSSSSQCGFVLLPGCRLQHLLFLPAEGTRRLFNTHLHCMSLCSLLLMQVLVASFARAKATVCSCQAADSSSSCSCLQCMHAEASVMLTTQVCMLSTPLKTLSACNLSGRSHCSLVLLPLLQGQAPPALGGYSRQSVICRTDN